MIPRPITDMLSVSPQIAEADVAVLKERGFRALICNRPDGEEDGQPDFRVIADAARRLGMDVRHIPISGSPVAPQDVEAFRDAFGEMPKPILAYCRSGTRSALLWALAQTGNLSMHDILSLTSAAGYDLAEAIDASLPAQREAEEGEDTRKTGTGT